MSQYCFFLEHAIVTYSSDVICSTFLLFLFSLPCTPFDHPQKPLSQLQPTQPALSTFCAPHSVRFCTISGFWGGGESSTYVATVPLRTPAYFRDNIALPSFSALLRDAAALWQWFIKDPPSNEGARARYGFTQLTGLHNRIILYDPSLRRHQP